MNGLSLYDDLVKVLYDDERDVEYPAWTCMNNEKMAERAMDLKAVPLIYSFKSAGSTQLNHEIATAFRTSLQKGKIKLLVNHLEGQDHLINLGEFDINDEEKIDLLKPYIQTTSLINEMIKLEYSVDTGWVKVYEVGRNRKDRYSSLAYANYFIDIYIEKDLKHETFDKADDIVYF